MNRGRGGGWPNRNAPQAPLSAPPPLAQPVRFRLFLYIFIYMLNVIIGHLCQLDQPLEIIAEVEVVREAADLVDAVLSLVFVEQAQMAVSF